jgi:hypothetical protein
MKTRLILFALAAVFAACIIATVPAAGAIVAAMLLLAFIGSLLYPTPLCRLNVGPTLSVPELLQDVLEAFKLETPELFGPNGFGTDFSSQTAVLGDKITGHIDILPTSANYDPTPGVGFYSGVQNVETLISDVPITLAQFIHVPVRVKWLTQLSSKLPLYKRAIHNIGYVMGKTVVDAALAQIVGNFSNKIVINPANISLDSMEAIRSQLNTQKVLNRPRWGLATTGFAAALQNDDRVKSSLFYGFLNGDEGYRMFRNIAGTSWLKEYPDFSKVGNNIQAFFGDPRAIVVATRKPDFSNAAAQLGCPEIMRFFPMSDPESGIQAMGVMWQEQGTGDVIVSCAILFGVGAGNQGGAAGSGTDNAGVIVTTQ